uniref:CD320 molecule n=1 Tax=Macaca nemestrina TaxID=9545 RepID=A0A2K6BFR5_MACNE
STSGWMARGGAQRTGALGLALRLLLGLGLGLEVAATPLSTRTSAQASGIEPCTQNGQCPPPPGLPCPCTGVSDCSGRTDKKLRNCSRPACPAGELRCTLSDDCIPLTWRCDGHPDCPDSSDELGCGTNETLLKGDATTTGPPVTPESVTSVENVTSSSAGNQSGSPGVYGVIAAAAVLSASLVAVTLLLLSWLRAQERLRPLGLLVAMKESLLLSERKTSLP